MILLENVEVLPDEFEKLKETSNKYLSENDIKNLNTEIP